LPQLAAFAHVRDVHVLSIGSKVGASVIQARGVVMSATWVDAGPVLGDVLVVCTAASVELFARRSLIPFHVLAPLEEFPVAPYSRAFARGAASVLLSDGTPVLYVGTCTGVVHSFSLAPTVSSSSSSAAPAPIVTSTAKHQTPLAAITCIASTPDRRPIVCAGLEHECVGATWICADDAGAIAVYGDQCQQQLLQHTRVALFAACGSPCVAVAFHPSCPAIIAAFGTGHVRVFSLDSHSVAVEICAHARPVIALHVHPSLPLAVTASEDGWLRCWSLASAHVACPQPQQHQTTITVKQTFAVTLPSTMWTGVQFLGNDSLAALAYDTPFLFLFSPDT
jgi:hypothetical protein